MTALEWGCPRDALTSSLSYRYNSTVASLPEPPASHIRVAGWLAHRYRPLNPETQVDDNEFFVLGDESSCFCGNVAVCKGKKSKQPAPSPSSPLSPSSSDDSFHFSTGMIVFVSIVGTLVAVALVNIAVRARRRQLADREFQPMASGVQGV